MRPVILYRTKSFEEDEKDAAEKAGFFCTKYFTDLRSGDLVLPRYAMLGGGSELEHDINTIGAKLLNSWKQFRFIADLANWYEVVNDEEELTPKTWFHLDQIPEEGEFFLKGETNSKKFYFDSCAYAKNKKEAIQVYLKLCDDGWIGTQCIVIREYIPLKTYFISEHGLPITNEFRFFVLNGKIMGGGYYWSNFSEDLKEKNIYPDITSGHMDFVQKIINKVGTIVNGYVVDIGETVAGNFILIELNAIEQSGCSDLNLEELYKNLYIEVVHG